MLCTNSKNKKTYYTSCNRDGGIYDVTHKRFLFLSKVVLTVR